MSEIMWTLTITCYCRHTVSKVEKFWMGWKLSWLSNWPVNVNSLPCDCLTCTSKYSKGHNDLTQFWTFAVVCAWTNCKTETFYTKCITSCISKVKINNNNNNNLNWEKLIWERQGWPPSTQQRGGYMSTTAGPDVMTDRSSPCWESNPLLSSL
jgi:hypothetical protein